MTHFSNLLKSVLLSIPDYKNDTPKMGFKLFKIDIEVNFALTIM